MGKAGGKKKKNNPGVGVDFKRVRNKVGKKLPKAQNHTDTTIRSRAINLPGQNIRTEEEVRTASGTPAVTQRNLNLKELLGQSSHYSEKVRREALVGLGELLTSHPREARKSPYELLERLSGRMTDSDSAVRKALIPLLKDVVLPALEGCDATAFLSMVMAHLCSAMTHIADQVREDSLLLLEVLMGWAPGEIVDGYLARCLAQFGHLLSSSQRGRSVSTQSIASLLKAISSLFSFLETAAATNTKETGTADLGPFGASSAQRGPLTSVRCTWPPRSAYSMGPGASVAGRDVEEADAACTSLLQRLLVCWTECGPSHVATQPEPAAVECMAKLLGCVDLLMQRQQAQPDEVLMDLHIGKKGRKQKVSLHAAILHLVSPHFPLGLSSEPQPSADVKEGLSWVNIRCAQVLQRLLPISAGDVWAGRLVDFWVGICTEGLVLHCTDGGNVQSLQAGEASGVPEAATSMTLLSCREALFHLSSEQRHLLIQAVGTLAGRSAAKSATQLSCLAFQQKLLSRAVAMPGGLGSADNMEALLTEDEVASWLRPIPRMLWELGSLAPEVTDAALQLLITVGRLASLGSSLVAILDNLQLQIVPFYIILQKAGTTPKKNKPNKDNKKRKDAPAVMPGPLVALPLSTQQLAVDLLWYLPSLTESILRAVLMMALTWAKSSGKRASVYPTEIATRAVEIVIERCHSGTSQPHACAEVDAPSYLSFLLSLMVGDAQQLPDIQRWPGHPPSSSGDQHQGSDGAQVTAYWQRHAALLPVVAQATASVGLAEIGPALRAAAVRDPSPRTWLGLLYLADAALCQGTQGRGGQTLPRVLSELLPQAMVAYASECRGQAGDVDSALPQDHPGVGICLGLMMRLPPLLFDLLTLLPLDGATSLDADVPRGTDGAGATSPGQWMCRLRLLLVMCRHSRLREALLGVSELLVTTVDHLAQRLKAETFTAVYGPGVGHAAAQELLAACDLLLGKL